MARFEECRDVAREALGKDATDAQVDTVLERVGLRRAAAEAEGRVHDLADRVRELVAGDAAAERIAAAKARQHAARNAIVRDALNSRIDEHYAAGVKPREIMLSILEGIANGIKSGRHSVAATHLSYMGRFVKQMEGAILRDRPHLYNERALSDPVLSRDAMHEMMELRDGGTPGSTKNPDAQFLAKTFATFAEVSRQDLNRLGASIGKLDGWVPQVHDPIKLRQIPRDDWVTDIAGRLDWERTMPDVAPERRAAVLGDIYDTITTGIRKGTSATGRGEFVGPANVADRLSRERILHFKSGDDAVAYNERFGFGNLFTAIYKHQEAAARYAAQMRILGPNPEVMMKSLVEAMEKRVRNDPKLTAARKDEISHQLQLEGQTKLAMAWSVMTGFHLSVGNITGARIASGVRSVEGMAKLGGALISSIQDLVTAASNLSFHGNGGFFGQLARQTAGMLFEGRGNAAQREWALALGEGADSLLGHVVNDRYATDSMPGRIAQAMHLFHRWNGLSWWDEAGRAVNARTMSREMGELTGKSYGELSARYRHVLGLHDIGEAHWEALRQAAFKVDENGGRYVTPDRIRDLPDTAIAPLVEGKATPAKLADARSELELALGRFFADERRFGFPEPDAATSRVTTFGLQRGTLAGEAVRAVMQFKSFPAWFIQRPLARALHGAEDQGNAGASHIAALILGSTAIGYLAMAAKDAVRGYGLRDVSTPGHLAKVIAASMVQGGGLGIYGDFLFGEANRMNQNALESAMGPVFGTAGSVLDLWQRARAGEAHAGEALNIGLQNTPFINLFYARPALNALVLNDMHEWASPGWLARQRAQRMRDYGQRPLFQ